MVHKKLFDFPKSAFYENPKSRNVVAQTAVVWSALGRLGVERPHLLCSKAEPVGVLGNHVLVYLTLTGLDEEKLVNFLAENDVYPAVRGIIGPVPVDLRSSELQDVVVASCPRAVLRMRPPKDKNADFTSADFVVPASELDGL